MLIADSMGRIVLVGMMAAGKSSVGRAIAARTGWPYLDNDALVAESAGADRAALAEQRGVEELRRYERLALDQILEADAPLVASVAGGVLLADEAAEAVCRARARDAFVVWLRVPHSVLAQRIMSDTVARPWINPQDPLGSVVALAALREPVYQRVADFVVDAFDVEPETVAVDILSAAAVARATSEKTVRAPAGD